jgi:FAD-linked sulfhydryl oxidase
MLEKYPVKNDSREDLVNYLCYLHNKVNKRLNKPIFDCKEAFKFWGGECGCSEKSNTTSTSTNSTTNNTESNLK